MKLHPATLLFTILCALALGGFVIVCLRNPWLCSVSISFVVVIMAVMFVYSMQPKH